MKGIGIFLIIFYFLSPCYSQTEKLYIPVSINSPLFTKDRDRELQIGVKINNYALHFNLAALSKNKFLIFSVQQNNGNILFDPLNFSQYYNRDEEAHLIQTYPEKMFYCEFGFGYNLKLKSQKLAV